MVASYINPAKATKIKVIMQRAFATKMALGNKVELTLSRWNEAAQVWQTQPVQTVLMAYADKGAVTRGLFSGTAQIDGWFEKLEPFNIETADEFVIIGGGATNTGYLRGAVNVVSPPQNGIQRAGWVLTVGETP